MPPQVRQSIPMRTRNLDQLVPQMYVAVEYESSRSDNASILTRSGVLTSPDTPSAHDDAKAVFHLEDDEYGTHECVIGETVGESPIVSLGERRTPLGAILRVDCYSGEDEHRRLGISEALRGQFRSTYAVAQIKRYERILQWLIWSEQHA